MLRDIDLQKALWVIEAPLLTFCYFCPPEEDVGYCFMHIVFHLTCKQCLIQPPLYGETHVIFTTICGPWKCFRSNAAFMIDETSHRRTSVSCQLSVPSSRSIFGGLERDVVRDPAATLQADRPILSRSDPINPDGSETMNDDVSVWAPATCRSTNQLVFGQNKRLHTESTVVWRDASELTGYSGSAAPTIESVVRGIYPIIVNALISICIYICRLSAVFFFGASVKHRWQILNLELWLFPVGANTEFIHSYIHFINNLPFCSL